MADGLFADMRRFAVPPGRAYGSERFERRPRPMRARALARRWLERWRGTEGEPLALASYLTTPEEGLDRPARAPGMMPRWRGSAR